MQMQKFTPMANLKSPANLTCASLDCGRKLEHPKEAHMGPEEHANYTQRPLLAGGLKPRNLLAVRKRR